MRCVHPPEPLDAGKPVKQMARVDHQRRQRDGDQRRAARQKRHHHELQASCVNQRADGQRPNRAITRLRQRCAESNAQHDIAAKDGKRQLHRPVFSAPRLSCVFPHALKPIDLLHIRIFDLVNRRKEHPHRAHPNAAFAIQRTVDHYGLPAFRNPWQNTKSGIGFP